MKVCIATTSFPRWVGDHRAPFILETARAIQTHGVEVRVIAMHSPGARTREILESVEVIRPRYLWPERLEILQKQDGGLPVVWQMNRLSRLIIPLFIISHTAALTWYAKNCDIIHANWTLSGLSAWMGRCYHRRPFIVTIQGSDIFRATRIPFANNITRMVLNQAEQIIAISRALAEAAIALGTDPRRISVIPNGVDTDKFRPFVYTREPLILYVGSLIERKGLNFLIEAMPRVLRKFPEFYLIVIGDGPQKSNLINLAEELGIMDKVLFVGAQSQNQVSYWMQRAKLFVLASLEEGLGVVLLEALASALPCVASDVGGIRDIVSPEVGILVPPANPDALADAIISLLGNPSLWDKMSSNARQRAVECYSWKSISLRLIRLYQDVISRWSARK